MKAMYQQRDEALFASRPVTRTIAYRVLVGRPIPAEGTRLLDPPPPTDKATQRDEE